MYRIHSLHRIRILVYGPTYGVVTRQTPREQTGACENITFPQLRLQAVISFFRAENEQHFFSCYLVSRFAALAWLRNLEVCVIFTWFPGLAKVSITSMSPPTIRKSTLSVCSHQASASTLRQLYVDASNTVLIEDNSVA